TPPSEPTVEYDKSSNDKAIITITIPDENVTFVDSNGTYEFTKNGTYTIKYYNKFGELCSIDVVVDWLDETPPSEPIVEYDKSSNDKAIITITIPDENVTFVDGNGTYEFTKNGTYTIKYYNKNGELCSIDVVIDWLDESMVDNQNKDEKTNNLPLIIGIVVAIVVAIVFVLSVGIITAIVITKKRKSKN
ncbi:MAG: hypothetical protein K2O35_03720, partial [Clostridia bacterium]|nr:hypothetical protein [Clostridia bacterium]